MDTASLRHVDEQCSCPPRLRRFAAKTVDALSDEFQNRVHFDPERCMTPPRLRPPPKNHSETLVDLSFHEDAEASYAAASARQLNTFSNYP